MCQNFTQSKQIMTIRYKEHQQSIQSTKTTTTKPVIYQHPTTAVYISSLTGWDPPIHMFLTIIYHILIVLLLQRYGMIQFYLYEINTIFPIDSVSI